MRTHRAVVSGVAVMAAAAACGGGSSSKPPAGAGSAGTAGGSAGAAAVQHPKELVGDVGHNDAFAISLSDDSGHPITNLAAGTYKLTVKDESGIHDFHLSGAGVDRATTVPGTGSTTFTVTFRPGTYSFTCDPHAATMHGTFSVT